MEMTHQICQYHLKKSCKSTAANVCNIFTFMWFYILTWKPASHINTNNNSSPAANTNRRAPQPESIRKHFFPFSNMEPAALAIRIMQQLFYLQSFSVDSLNLFLCKVIFILFCHLRQIHSLTFYSLFHFL